MQQKLILEIVKVESLPKIDVFNLGNEHSQITRGDLHGNAINLLFTLFKHGIATNLDQSEYEQLVTLYEKHKEDLTLDDLNQFNQYYRKYIFLVTIV